MSDTSEERHAKKRATMMATFAATTGKSVDDWIDMVQQARPGGDPMKFNRIVQFLKTEHALGHFRARLIAEQVLTVEVDPPAASSRPCSGDEAEKLR